MKKLLFLGLILAAMTCAAIAVAADAPSGNVFDGFTWPDGKQAVAAFDHANHTMDCATCHHKMAENPDMKCTTCHNDFAEKKGDASAYNAFHNAKSVHSCLGCHKAEKKGPTKCAECHPK